MVFANSEYLCNPSKAFASIIAKKIFRACSYYIAVKIRNNLSPLCAKYLPTTYTHLMVRKKWLVDSLDGKGR